MEEIDKTEELTKSEEILSESELRYRHLFENMNDAVIVTDAETGLLIDINRQGEILLGWSRTEIISMHQSDIHPAGKCEEYRHMLQTHEDQGHLADYDGEVIRRDGTIVPVSISAAPVIINGKKLILGLFRDITERRNADTVLRETIEHYNALTELAADAIICLKHPDNVYMWNRKAEEMFGYSAEEALCKPLHQLIVPEIYREKAYAGLREFYQTGRGAVVGKTLELNALRRDGTEFPVELSVSAIKIRGEWHATAIIRDISERKRLENELMNKLDEIERFNKLMVGREVKMGEMKQEMLALKEEIAELRGRGGKV